MSLLAGTDNVIAMLSVKIPKKIMKWMEVSLYLQKLKYRAHERAA